MGVLVIDAPLGGWRAWRHGDVDARVGGAKAAVGKELRRERGARGVPETTNMCGF